MSLDIRVYANSDSATIVWRSDGHIDGCLGFAVHRRKLDANGQPIAPPEVLENRIGFAGDPNTKEFAHQSSEIWPIQRFIWSDFTAGAPFGQPAPQVSYQVVARIGTPGNLKDGIATAWSAPVTV